MLKKCLKLDKSGWQVYTGSSFSVGNKKLQFILKHLMRRKTFFQEVLILKQNRQKKKLHEHRKSPAVRLFALAAAVMVSVTATNWADALYVFTDADDSVIVLEPSDKTPDISSRLVYLKSGRAGFDIALNAKQTVTIHQQGLSTTLQAKKHDSISSLLNRAGIVPGPLDMIGVDVSDNTVEITITSQLTFYDTVTEDVTYRTIRKPNPDMAEGTEQVVQEGKDGVRTSIYEVVWADGQLVSRQFVEELDSTAVDKIVEYGTSVEEVAPSDRIVSVSKNADGSGTLYFQSGTALKFSDAKTMTATAYTAGHGGADFITATGTTVRTGTVAVDRKVIPLGTKMYIVTSDGIVYGLSVAEDTGVRGNIVDLYFHSYEECINFGRRSCTVYILE